MSGHGSKFGRKKEAEVAALLTARNHEEAARSIGIGPATLRRWQKEPEFDAAYREALRGSYKQSIGRMNQACRAAATDRYRTRRSPPSSVCSLTTRSCYAGQLAKPEHLKCRCHCCTSWTGGRPPGRQVPALPRSAPRVGKEICSSRRDRGPRCLSSECNV